MSESLIRELLAGASERQITFAVNRLARYASCIFWRLSELVSDFPKDDIALALRVIAGAPRFFLSAETCEGECLTCAGECCAHLEKFRILMNVIAAKHGLFVLPPAVEKRLKPIGIVRGGRTAH